MSIKPVDIVTSSNRDDQAWIRSVRDAVRDLRYGSVPAKAEETNR